MAAIADDLNTPLALASLSAPLKFINDLLTTKQGKKAVGRTDALKALTEAVEDTIDVVGLPHDGGKEILLRLKELALVRAGMTVEEIDEAIEKRTIARKEKNFEESDRIRDELSSRGIALMDGTETTWRPSPVLDDC